MKGRYKVLRAIGKGGMGLVYEAIHLDLGRKVAIKVLGEVADRRAIERFRREALAAAAIQHPNVVSVTDFAGGSSDVDVDTSEALETDPPFIAMELLPGRSLTALLAVERRLPVERAVSIAAQMLDGLDASHQQGIIHRDIKPSNVFLVDLPGNRHLVKLLDFGIAKLLEDDQSFRTTTGSFLGTPAYVSPEQVLGGGRDASNPIDARADVHAVSACLYEMLTGERAFRAATAVEVVAAILRPERPALVTNPDVPRDLAKVIERGLSRDRDARWPTARAMRDALMPWLEASQAPVAPTTTSSPAPPPMQPATKRSKSRLVIFAVGLGVTMLIGAVVAAAVMAKRKVAGETPYAPTASSSGSPSPGNAEVETDNDDGGTSSEDASTMFAIASASASASSSSSAPPPRLFTMRIAGVHNVDRASADEWWQKHEMPLRQKCGRRRSCANLLIIRANGISDVAFVNQREGAQKPPGCERKQWVCVKEYLIAHPIDPRQPCPQQDQRCEQQVTFALE